MSAIQQPLHQVMGQFDDAPSDPQNLYTSFLPLIEAARKLAESSSPALKPPLTKDEDTVQRKGHKRARENEVNIAPPLEGSQSTSSGITDADVLCGRGAGANNHAGNQEFRRLIISHRPRYFASRRAEKTRISRSIVKAIRARGGRFLKFDAGKSSWEDVGDSKAVEKTSQALREGGAEKFRAIVSSAKAYVPSTDSSMSLHCGKKLKVESCDNVVR